MGGVVNTITKGIGSGLGTVFTGGLNHTNLFNGFFKKAGNEIGNVLTLGTGRQAASSGGGNGVHTPNESPMDTLVNSGGAPLLTNIALGANVDDALASFLGISKDSITSGKGLGPDDVEAIKNLRSQLTDIQSNTDMRNKAVTNLVNDFPNYVQQAIPKYASTWDDNMKGVMDQALQKVGASYAANGGLSSGAMAAASARAATGVAGDRLNYSSGLALQDFNQKLSETTALQSFQQKMLGQGATQGFNAVQNSLSRNATSNDISLKGDINAKAVADARNNGSNDGMWGSLGGLAGSVLGPAGSVIGNQVGNMVSQYFKGPANGAMDSYGPANLRLNTGPTQPPLDLFGGGNGYDRYSGGR